MNCREFKKWLAAGGRTSWWSNATPKERMAFLDGFNLAAWLWAVWKDGKQWLGIGNTSLSAVLETTGEVALSLEGPIQEAAQGDTRSESDEIERRRAAEYWAEEAPSLIDEPPLCPECGVGRLVFKIAQKREHRICFKCGYDERDRRVATPPPHNKERIDPTEDESPCAECGHMRLEHVHEPIETATPRFVDGMCSIPDCHCSEWQPRDTKSQDGYCPNCQIVRTQPIKDGKGRYCRRCGWTQEPEQDDNGTQRR